MKTILLLLLCTTACLQGFGQEGIDDHEYLINTAFLSPSNVGFNGNHEIFTGYQHYLTGFDNAPINAWVDYNGLVAKNMGLGAQIRFEKAGFFRNVRANLNYAYHLNIAKKHRLSIGIRTSLNQTRMDVSRSNSDPSSDPLVMSTTAATGMTFNAGVGITYAFKGLNVVVAVPYILNNKRKDGSNVYTQPMLIRSFVSYNIEAGKNWSIKPQALINYTKGDFNYAFAASVKFKNRIWVNAGYQSGTIISAGLGGLIVDRVALQYTYSLATAGLIKVPSGVHEIVIGIVVGKINKSAAGNSLFKSSKQTPYYDWE